MEVAGRYKSLSHIIKSSKTKCKLYVMYINDSYTPKEQEAAGFSQDSVLNKVTGCSGIILTF